MFEITHQEKNCLARTGILHTDHGDVETPIFMPVGTQATVKSLDNEDLKNIDAQIILANTYHLHLRPGENLIADSGGIHKFMNWDRPVLTDSGGFQVFSLGKEKVRKQVNNPPYKGRSTRAKRVREGSSLESSNTPPTQTNNQTKLVKIDNDGVTFRSHIDGSTHRFTPEEAINIQHKIGADIIMAFDECTPDDANEKYTKKAMERTHDWARRCLIEHTKLQRVNLPSEGRSTRAKRVREGSLGSATHKKFLFGIIQGANHKHLREESAKFISSLDFDGIAIGGESVGYNMEATKQILDWVNPIIPKEKPHYTMGVGHSPLDLFEVVERGVDMFDCVSPTRIARNGTLYISPLVGGIKGGSSLKEKKYTLNIRNTKHRNDPNPIDPTCTCFTCQNHSRQYLHHLFKAGEMLAYRLATIHNLHFMLNLMKRVREKIRENKFLEMKKEWTQ